MNHNVGGNNTLITFWQCYDDTKSISVPTSSGYRYSREKGAKKLSENKRTHSIVVEKGYNKPRKI